MTESYTIESADDSAPIGLKLLRELRDLLREDDELDLGVKLRDRQPAPGEQGAIPVALEIIATVTPLGTAFAGVLKHWIDKHHGMSIKISRKGDDFSIQLSGATGNDTEWLIAQLKSEAGAQPYRRD
jgi:Effector Associated Constant Component 1